MVGDHVDAQAGDLAVGRGGDFAVHVVVAGKGGGRDVLDPVLNPFHRTTQHNGRHDGTHIAGVDTDLVAEAAADVGADDADLGLRNAREHGHHGAHHVGRLRGDEGGELALDGVEAGHAATGLQRAGVHARVVHVLADLDRGRVERSVRGRLVARVPGEDVVVVLALAVRAFSLAGQVFAQHRGIGRQGGVGVQHHRQLFVLHLHGFHRVGRDVAVVGDDDGDFLHLEVHFFVGQHSGDVACERGHPVQLQRLQVVGRKHRVNAGDGERGFLVDLDDAAMGDRRAHDVHVQHARHLDVVDVVALALNKAGVLFAQTRSAHAGQGEFTGFGVWYRCVHVVFS